MEEHKNWTFIIEDMISINLGGLEELWELEIGKPLTVNKQADFTSLLREVMDLFV